MTDESMLTVKEVATLLKLQPRTVSNMAQRGELPAIKIGRRWRFRRADIAALQLVRSAVRSSGHDGAGSGSS